MRNKNKRKKEWKQHHKQQVWWQRKRNYVENETCGNLKRSSSSSSLVFCVIGTFLILLHIIHHQYKAITLSRQQWNLAIWKQRQIHTQARTHAYAQVGIRTTKYLYLTIKWMRQSKNESKFFYHLSHHRITESNRKRNVRNFFYIPRGNIDFNLYKKFKRKRQPATFLKLRFFFPL